MLTIVVPTMWRYEPFVQFLDDLTKPDIVDQIIVINNDKERTPQNRPTHSKIEYVDNEYNIFVNPAFNLGVQLARNENVCIINDDVLFGFQTLYAADRFLNEHPECGVLGICPGETKYQHPPFINGSIDFIEWHPDISPAMFFGFCMLFFVRKSEWLPIPIGLNLYYGDDWVVRTQPLFNKKIYSITNSFFYTPYAQTCSKLTLPDDTLAREGEIFNQAFNELKNDRKDQMVETTQAPDVIYVGDIIKSQAQNLLISGRSPVDGVLYDVIGFDNNSIEDILHFGHLSTSKIVIEYINNDTIGDISYYILTFLRWNKNWVVDEFYYQNDGWATVILGKV